MSSLKLRNGTGELTAELADVVIVRLPGEQGAMRVDFVLEADAYRLVEESGGFHLDAARVPLGQTSGSVSIPNGVPVDVEAQLSAQLAAGIAPLAPSAGELKRLLVSRNQSLPDDPLFDTRSWFALTVRPVDESLGAGFATRWLEVTNHSALVNVILRDLDAWMKENEWKTTVESDFQLSVEVKSGVQPYRARFTVLTQPWSIVVTTHPVLGGDKATALQLAEFLARANAGIPIGDFELSWETRKVYFKAPAILPEPRFFPYCVGEAFESACVWTNRYLGALIDVAAGRATPEEAVSKVDGEDA